MSTSLNATLGEKTFTKPKRSCSMAASTISVWCSASEVNDWPTNVPSDRVDELAGAEREAVAVPASDWYPTTDAPV